MVVLSITDIGINLPVLIAQTVSFVFLLAILRTAIYGPVLKILDERKARIQEQK
jgi:F0F1-type ATP synthase membrane subunit b/b'